jgi:ubiquinone/menaquinone biosynthesis C-methylase UbiE
MPAGSEAVLDRRSLHLDHRHLAGLLEPGLAVLDVGCGSGAITREIADAVAADGSVVGLDVNADLLEHARRNPRPNLVYVHGDVRTFEWPDLFDVVTAARVLQWLADPAAALAAIARLTRPGGSVVVLDYDHTAISWEPPAPPSVERFYQSFLRWREDAGMSNRIAAQLEDLYAAAGLQGVIVADADEDADHGSSRIQLWGDVIAARGHQLVRDDYLAEELRRQAEREFSEWAASPTARQRMCLRAAIGLKPG